MRPALQRPPRAALVLVGATLITLGAAYHIIRPMVKEEGVFIYTVLDKSRANLAMARRKIAEIEKGLVF